MLEYIERRRITRAFAGATLIPLAVEVRRGLDFMGQTQTIALNEEECIPARST